MLALLPLKGSLYFYSCDLLHVMLTHLHVFLSIMFKHWKQIGLSWTYYCLFFLSFFLREKIKSIDIQLYILFLNPLPERHTFWHTWEIFSFEKEKNGEKKYLLPYHQCYQTYSEVSILKINNKYIENVMIKPISAGILIHRNFVVANKLKSRSGPT